MEWPYPRVLVVGAGALGCEVLCKLCQLGVQELHMIDHDTIELSNLHRQFIYREGDIGKKKALVAAAYISHEYGIQVHGYACRMEALELDWYRSFDCVFGCLDSIEGRRWLNKRMHDLLAQNEAGPGAFIPYIDGGTEGYNGQAFLIQPGQSACIECHLNLFQTEDHNLDTRYPLCTILHEPILPEHTITWAATVAWEKVHPERDWDLSSSDLAWLHDTAVTRAAAFDIPAFTIELTKRTLENVIPSIVSTNSVVASLCVMLASQATRWPRGALMLYNGSEGFYQQTHTLERTQSCYICSGYHRNKDI